MSFSLSFDFILILFLLKFLMLFDKGFFIKKIVAL
jgi:hypothetical protein